MISGIWQTELGKLSSRQEQPRDAADKGWPFGFVL
jgi:hypothetical protein